MYIGNESGDLSNIFGYVLRITFLSNLAGQTFTVSAGNQTVKGVVPSSLYVEVIIQELNTNCIISCTGTTATTSLTIPEYYGFRYVLFGVGNTLNEVEWSVISEIADKNQGANYWAVGDYKDIRLSKVIYLAGTYRAFIIGFNHNSSWEGNKRIHFMIGKNVSGQDIAFCEEQYGTQQTQGQVMNTTRTSEGGWESSYMRNTMLSASSTSNPSGGSFMNVIPDDLRAVLKPCTKYTDNVSNGNNVASSVTATTDYMWLLSEFEVFGKRLYANVGEQNYQQQYQYFKSGNSKVKYGTGHQTTTTVEWWLRSVFFPGGTLFCRVNTSGQDMGGDANLSLGVAPCYCV